MQLYYYFDLTLKLSLLQTLVLDTANEEQSTDCMLLTTIVPLFLVGTTSAVRCFTRTDPVESDNYGTNYHGTVETCSADQVNSAKLHNFIRINEKLTVLENFILQFHQFLFVTEVESL